MKVLFVINSLKEKSGIERVACLLANSFDLDLGFEIKIANRDTEKKDTSYNLNASIDVVNVGGGYYKFFKGINVLVKDFKPDYIFIHNMGRLSLLCSLLSKVDVKKIISLEHVAFQVRPNWVKFLTKILYKRIETFFEEDKDINRNTNIKKAFEYGYTKTEIANFLELSTKTISRILK